MGTGVLFLLSSFLLLATLPAAGQALEAERPVPILTGSAGFFDNVTGGHTELSPVMSPVLLLPLGDRWLVESRAEFEGDFEAKPNQGAFGGRVNQEVDYAQVDYIANQYFTVTAGRFLTPFGIFNERLYPVWIRNLQPVPLIFPIATGSSDGLMLRGGFSASPDVSINYAAYYSALSTINKLDSDRLAGARVGFFFPKPRVEMGVSFQKTLQEDRPHAIGAHFAWQPNPIPLNLRTEYAWSADKGSGYWIEAAYRLSQMPHWQPVMKRLEAVGRAQHFFAGQITASDASEYGLPNVNTRQGDFGLNYYLRDGLKAAASYGRSFSSDGNLNIWTVGIAYRFAIPLGRVGGK
jgi:hypothetical protein